MRVFDQGNYRWFIGRAEPLRSSDGLRREYGSLRAHIQREGQRVGRRLVQATERHVHAANLDSQVAVRRGSHEPCKTLVESRRMRGRRVRHH